MLMRTTIFCGILMIMLTSCRGENSNSAISTSKVRETYVVNSSANTVSVYDRELNGNIDPLRTFGNMTGMNTPYGIAIDTAHNQIFVCNYYGDSITIYGRTAQGNSAPVRSIVGEDTGLDGPTGILLDTLHNEIIVSNYNAITVYDMAATGNSKPVRVLYSLWNITGIALTL